MRHLRIVATVSALVLLAAGALQVSADVPANDAFERTWSRTDKPVADQVVDRTWMWGPEAFTDAIDEDYAGAPGGKRVVQYFDKSRMEDNAYRGADPWDVTNGLLVVELITGQMQMGDDEFESHEPADILVAGDPTSASVPTYAALAALMDDPAHETGSLIVSTVAHDGAIGTEARLAAYGATAHHHVVETGHTVAEPFWAFMTSTGPVHEDGQVVSDALFEDPFYATGYPITEAHWTRAMVDGAETDVLVQAFQRRVLTYTPSNPAGWQVESGNVGRHYYDWRHGQHGGPDETPTATPTEEPTATPTEEPTEEPTVAPACDPAYPDFCVAPPPPDLECDDDALNGEQDFTVLDPDPHDFDTDGDGVGCESDGSTGGGSVPVIAPDSPDPDWDGPTKLIDTNVAGALVCVYAAGGVNQDGKPTPIDFTEDDCELLLGAGKGDDGAGQGEPDTFFAHIGEESAAGIAYNDATNELSVVVEVEGLLPGADYNAVIAGFAGCDLNNDGDCDDAGETVGGDNAVCSPDAAATLPNDFSGSAIIDLGTAEADAGGDLAVTFEETLTAAQAQALGNLEDNVVVVTDDMGAIVACGIIEAGTFGRETPEEAAVRLGAVVVGVTDADGDIVFGLPAGSYVAVVTAAGYDLAVEEFTLEDDEAEINEVNLVSD